MQNVVMEAILTNGGKPVKLSVSNDNVNWFVADICWVMQKGDAYFCLTPENNGKWKFCSFKTPEEINKDRIKEKNVRLMKEKMINLKNAFVELNEVWDIVDSDEKHKLSKKYPFYKSFDDLCFEVVDWVEFHNKKKYTVGVYEVWEQMHEVEAFSKKEAMSKIANQESKILEDQFSFVEIDEDPFRFYNQENKND